MKEPKENVAYGLGCKDGYIMGLETAAGICIHEAHEHGRIDQLGTTGNALKCAAGLIRAEAKKRYAK